MMTPTQAAALWGISDRRVYVLCKEGRIPGAYKKGRGWLIPMDAKKPSDHRQKEPRSSATKKKLPLPVGISDYRKACSEYYYVDKTLMIRDFLDERPQVSLFTRPRRFGKTLNMDMFRVFFEKTCEDSSVYFRDKNIWTCGDEYRNHQGKYPVIFVTFKDVKCETWGETYDLLCKILRSEFRRHDELLDSEKLSHFDHKYIYSILDGSANENDMAMALQILSQMLHTHHGEPPIIIVDEYDTPIQQGHANGFYQEVILFMRKLFSGGLKDNPHCKFGFLTGILRVAKESIFSGLNNLTVNSILDNKYSEYFGFTKDEVKEMASYYGAANRLHELCCWYDGYRFGNTDIYNPWSVINYFRNDCTPGAYWQSTGSNEIIREVLSLATPEIMNKLRLLMQGESFHTKINTGVIYPQIREDAASIYSFLLVAGYLKAIESDSTFGVDYMCRVSLPNKEISYVYSNEILSQLNDLVPASSAAAIQEAIYARDISALQLHLKRFLEQTVSFHDASKETFYHGFVLGLCAMLDNCYRITSNRESGDGRFDIQLAPLNKKLPGILIELKASKSSEAMVLSKLADAALEQIDKNRYDTELRTLGVQTIIKYAIVFSGKNVKLAVSTETEIPSDRGRQNTK